MKNLLRFGAVEAGVDAKLGLILSTELGEINTSSKTQERFNWGATSPNSIQDIIYVIVVGVIPNVSAGGTTTVGAGGVIGGSGGGVGDGGGKSAIRSHK